MTRTSPPFPGVTSAPRISLDIFLLIVIISFIILSIFILVMQTINVLVNNFDICHIFIYHHHLVHAWTYLYCFPIQGSARTSLKWALIHFKKVKIKDLQKFIPSPNIPHTAYQAQSIVLLSSGIHTLFSSFSLISFLALQLYFRPFHLYLSWHFIYIFVPFINTFFDTLFIFSNFFIGPESNHWLCLVDLMAVNDANCLVMS